MGMSQCHWGRTAFAHVMEDTVVRWLIHYHQGLGGKALTICHGLGNIQSALSKTLFNASFTRAMRPRVPCSCTCVFFVNNQYRILFEKDGIGSTNLEQVFESTLSRIGRMVAILDDWYCPVYLTRIWTIFEQFTAIKLGNINVTMVLPASAKSNFDCRNQRR